MPTLRIREFSSEMASSKDRERGLAKRETARTSLFLFQAAADF